MMGELTISKDVKAPDGELIYGWRLVRKRNGLGAVKFNGDWWEHPDLLRWIGKKVWVENDSGYWCTRISVSSMAYDMGDLNLICRIGTEG